MLLNWAAAAVTFFENCPMLQRPPGPRPKEVPAHPAARPGTVNVKGAGGRADHSSLLLVRRARKQNIFMSSPVRAEG